MHVVYQVAEFERGDGRHSGRHRRSVLYSVYSVIEIYAVTILMTFFCFHERYWTTESSPRVLMVVQLPCYNTILALCRLLLELTRSNVRNKPNVDAEF